MRTGLILAPLLLVASPVAAQPAPPEVRQVQQALSDPAIANNLVTVMETLSKAMLQLPVGDLQAAVQGRKPTAADHHRTVGSESRMSERELNARIEAARPMLQQSMKALADALPSMMQGLGEAQQAIERAAANMPDPNYPRR